MRIQFSSIPDNDRKHLLGDPKCWEAGVAGDMNNNSNECLEKTLAIREKAAKFLIDKIDSYDGLHKGSLTFDMLPLFRTGATDLFSCADVWHELRRNSLYEDFGSEEFLDLISDNHCHLGTAVWDVTGEGMRGWRVAAQYSQENVSSGVNYSVYDYIRGLDTPNAVPTWGMRVCCDGSVIMTTNSMMAARTNMNAAELGGYMQLLKELHDRARNCIPYKYHGFESTGIRINPEDL